MGGRGGLSGKECERQEGRKGGKERMKEERRTLLVSKTSRGRGLSENGGRLGEVCLVSVPAGGILAVCEAFADSQLHQQATGVSHVEPRSCSSAEADPVPVGPQTSSLRALSVAFRARVYTEERSKGR